MLAVAVALLALLLREQFILFGNVEVPIRGDIRQYVIYAINLVQEATFSSTPGGSQIVPDDFRGPGYPIFLAGAMLASRGDDTLWYWLALHAQAVLGALTVLLTAALSRAWLRDAGALCAALLLALWPHHIAATGALLSEVVFGAALVAGVWLADRTAATKRKGQGAAAGLVFGYAYLVNPIVLFFPPVAALILMRRGARAAAVAMLCAFALLVGAWGLRNATLPPTTATGRAAMNFVEGSWPLYHDAWRERGSSSGAAEYLKTVAAEERLVSSQPATGMRQVGRRLMADPGYYGAWYAIEKPFLLWDWDIRMGMGDVYVLAVDHSPLETNPILHGVKATFRRLNPAIFILATIASIIVLLRSKWMRHGETAALLCALFFLYATCIHVVFQAEPRYSIPYRPFELLLAVCAVGWIFRHLRALVTRTQASRA
jgi:uncharacterized protein YqgC (DUF456 family)